MKLNLAGNQIVDLIKNAEKTLVLLPNGPSADAVAAALALKSQAADFGKEADVVCFGSMPTALLKPEDVSKIKNQLEPTDLVISFNWAQSMIEKVSYSVEGEKFNLIITPSGKRLDPTRVEYSYRGANYNLIICLGIASIEELPANLVDRNIFKNISVVNIDKELSNTSFGKINVVDSESDSLSGLVVEILRQSSFGFSEAVAKYLLFGIRSATDNFDQVNNPATFEQAAYATKMKNPSSTKFGEQETTWTPPKTVPSSKTS